jgi:aarF domain-containing kinase
MEDFISDHLRKELDFIAEANNAKITAKFVAEEPRLVNKVYVPKIYDQYTTKKVLTAEWINGIRLTDRIGIKQLMGEVPASPDGPAPLQGGIHSVLETMVELFSAQIFQWGWVHCDPHPGNIIVRPNPTNPKKPQFVLLDHGLYVRTSPKFQRQYATLWKGLMTMDFNVIKDVATEWGIGAPDFFASAQLMRPVKFTDPDNPDSVPVEEMDDYQRNLWMKEKLKNYLTDTDKMPKELVFIGRNIRCVLSI